MKKIIVFLVVLFTSVTMYAQWECRTIDSPFDGKFGRAYAFAKTGNIMMLEEESSFMSAYGYYYPSIIFNSLYYCEDDKLVEFVFIVNGEKKHYDGIGYVTNDNKKIIIDPYIWNDDFMNDFKASSKLYIRVGDGVCDDEIYEFNMSGSGAAYRFVTKSY